MTGHKFDLGSFQAFWLIIPTVLDLNLNKEGIYIYRNPDEESEDKATAQACVDSE